jgi:D-cysteine desulfhydrase
MALDSIPRVRLGLFPTPLQHVADLAPGLEDLLLKRDDLTGFAWGGNKVRTVEFVLADALERGAETLVVAGGPGSNFAALLAIAAATSGLEVQQICYGSPRGAAALAVSRRAGAEVVFTGSDDRQSMEVVARELAERLTTEGTPAYAVPRGGATPVGACGFAVAAAELVSQLDERDLPRATVVLPVGSGGSISGLLAGLGVNGHTDRVDIVGVSVSRSPAEVGPRITACAFETARLVGGGEPSPRWRLVDGRAGGPEADQLTREALRHSGLVADPVYNVKALRWLADRRAELREPTVYWSTGGALAAADTLITTFAEAGTGSVAVGAEANP